MNRRTTESLPALSPALNAPVELLGPPITETFSMRLNVEVGRLMPSNPPAGATFDALPAPLSKMWPLEIAVPVTAATSLIAIKKWGRLAMLFTTVIVNPFRSRETLLVPMPTARSHGLGRPPQLPT